jgi:hypothetical protein
MLIVPTPPPERLRCRYGDLTRPALTAGMPADPFAAYSKLAGSFVSRTRNRQNLR